MKKFLAITGWLSAILILGGVEDRDAAINIGTGVALGVCALPTVIFFVIPMWLEARREKNKV